MYLSVDFAKMTNDQLLVFNLAVFLDSLIDVVKVNNMIFDSVLEKNFFFLGIGRKLGRVQAE